MALNPDSPLGKLMATLPQTGQVTWIGVRPARDVAMLEVDAAQVTTGIGLVGDRYKGGSGKRGVTLIQAEHLPVIAALQDTRPSRRPRCGATWWCPAFR